MWKTLARDWWVFALLLCLNVGKQKDKQSSHFWGRYGACCWPCTHPNRWYLRSAPIVSSRPYFQDLGEFALIRALWGSPYIWDFHERWELPWTCIMNAPIKRTRSRGFQRGVRHNISVPHAFPHKMLSSIKMTGFLKMPLFIFVVFARFQALTAKI